MIGETLKLFHYQAPIFSWHEYFDSVSIQFLFTLLNFSKDMERAIMRDLVSHILQLSVHVNKAVNFAAELDW